jgi:predicted regulator of Ras-like GTPase activity (Roadblock/LC7/MglB family)
MTAPARPSTSQFELPLASVIANLPTDLRSKLITAPAAGATLRLPVDAVISQLAFGAVKISFGELRRLATGLFVNASSELDNKPVSLPLQEILLRLNPALLARRTTKKVEVAEEIVGPFAGRGQGFTFTTHPLKGAPAAVPTSPAAPEPSAALVPPIAVRPSAPPPTAPPIAQRSITPATPTAPTNPSSGTESSALPISPFSPRSITPAAPGLIGSNGHSNGHHTNGNGHSLPAAPGARPAPLNGNGHTEMPAPLGMAPQPAAPAGTQIGISVTLGELSEKWPDALKQEILRLYLTEAKVALGSVLILPGLKRGRIVMTWRQLRLLAQPGTAPSPNDDQELELPLKVIAPLFMAAQKNAPRAQAKASVSADIPDLFFGFPQPASAPAASAPTVLATPAAPSAPPAPATPLIPPLPKALEPQPLDTNYYTLADKAGMAAMEEVPPRSVAAPQTDFTNRQAHPKEVVARAAALNGVAGAVVAMQDGLRVASQVPPELSGDTLAAFLPQIFERVNQSTRELRMGALNNINFTVGNVPWKIFRVNAVYFAAFGRAGEQLPSAQLAQLAAELDRKKV